MHDPAFQSVFKDEFRNLVMLKRSLGFKYETDATAFGRIDSFLSENGLAEKHLSRELCDACCRKRSHESAANHTNRISSLRVFCRYISSLGIPACIPPRGLVRHPPKYDAHIYTEDELHRFFAVVDASQSVPSECPYRALVMPVFFRILYTSGMRVSELRLARLQDVNLEDGSIRVWNGKNHKDRLVPIHLELIGRCASLKEEIHTESTDDEFFFMVHPGREMTLQNLYHNFRRYLEKAGIPHTGRGPRIHDCQHTYCVNLLLKWTQEGKDLLAYLPYMRTMLDHESFEETAYYIKLTASAFQDIRKSLTHRFRISLARYVSMNRNSIDFAQLVTDFLPLQRNYSKNTILSYRDTLKLFVLFLTERKGFRLNTFAMESFDRQLVIEYREWLRSRGAGISTANQRLAAIKTFAEYAGVQCIEYLALPQMVQGIKAKKSSPREIVWLSVEQISKLVNYSDVNTRTGLRHRVVMTLLYDSGCRVQELCDLRIRDINTGNSPTLRLHGKGDKYRTVTISANTAKLVSEYMDRQGNVSLIDELLITNRGHGKMSRDGVNYIISRYVKEIRRSDPSFPEKYMRMDSATVKPCICWLPVSTSFTSTISLEMRIYR